MSVIDDEDYRMRMINHLIISVSSNSDLSYSVKVLSHGENVTVNSRCSNA